MKALFLEYFLNTTQVGSAYKLRDASYRQLKNFIHTLIERVLKDQFENPDKDIMFEKNG